MNLQTVQRILLTQFFSVLAIVLLMVGGYELEMLPVWEGANEPETLFVLQVTMELLTIVCVPVALKLFSVKRIRAILLKGKADALLRWGMARLNLLGLPIIANVFLYYQTMSPTFGYMGIIIFLCLFFVYPSYDRCQMETEEVEEEQQ